MEQYLPYAGSLLGIMGAFTLSLLANRNASIAKSEARADKARSDYVGLLENRIKALEDSLQACLNERKIAQDERDYWNKEAYRLGRRVAELEMATGGGA